MSGVYESLQEHTVNGEAEEYNARCENLSTLIAHLQRLLKGRDKLVLVFDGVDKQREAQPTLLPALARLEEFVRFDVDNPIYLAILTMDRSRTSQRCS